MTGYPTTDTFDSLIDEVITSLQGFGANVDQLSTLTSPCSDSDIVLQVDGDTVIGRGIVEIDQELIYVMRQDGTTLYLAPWGRGWKGTTKAAHAANAAIFVSPTYPRSIVAREVNNTIRSVYPSLFAVGSAEISTNPRDWQYGLPADCDIVISVDWKWSAALTQWEPLSSWEQVQKANTSDFNSGNFLAVGTPLPANSTLHILYMKSPTLLTSGADGFAATTGLPASCRDVIVYGAATRLLPWLDGSHVAQESVPSDAQDQARPPGTAIQVAREMRNQYLMRLQQERTRLLTVYPMRAHKIRNG